MNTEEYTRISAEGERVVEGDPERLLVPHRERYEFALKYIEASDHVLDCAAGSGYGSELLADHANKVTAVDISEDVVQWCRSKYLNKNLEFKVGTAEKIPLPSQSVDVYCSFETIEHVDDPHLLLTEARRVLKLQGILLVSTPNRVTTGLGPGEKPHTPFHKMEWSLMEFDKILKAHFGDVKYFGQRVRCPNKFEPKYVASKLKRALGVRDFVKIDLAPSEYFKMESFPFWQPENFYAVCKV